MKKIITFTVLLLCFASDLLSQTDKFASVLFKKVTSDLGYSEWDYWMIEKTAKTKGDTLLELVGFDNEGNPTFRLKIDKADFCQKCGEMVCEYNGITFTLYDPVKNGEGQKKMKKSTNLIWKFKKHFISLYYEK